MKDLLIINYDHAYSHFSSITRIPAQVWRERLGYVAPVNV